jgi:glucose-1-phosphate adenylyltransferase
MTTVNSPFNFYDARLPIYTHPRFLPGSIIEDTHLKDALITEGCLIRGASITHSMIGVRSKIGTGTVIKDSILMGSDYYERRARNIQIGIGQNCHIEGAILDKNVQIGDGVIIKPFPRGTDLDAGTWAVQDGVVVIPKDTIVPAGTRIAPE